MENLASVKNRKNRINALEARNKTNEKIEICLDLIFNKIDSGIESGAFFCEVNEPWNPELMGLLSLKLEELGYVVDVAVEAQTLYISWAED